MRPLAIIPILCCMAALILSFLCLFAGHKRSFMEDYHLITLNTSRIGYNVLDTSEESSSSNRFTEFVDDVKDKFKEEVNEFTGDMAQRLGVDDFYSLHLLTFCYGDYTPAPLANETLEQSDIEKNVTACSNRTAMFAWDPTETIEQKLEEAGVGITLEDLGWPDDIQDGIDALKTLQKTTFVLYCVSIALIFLSFVAAIPAILMSGRLSACVNIMLAALAFLAIGLASALVTAIIVKGSDVINEHGNDIGVEAHRGGKFMAITWAATGLMFIALLVWCFETCFGHRRRQPAYVPKHG